MIYFIDDDYHSVAGIALQLKFAEIQATIFTDACEAYVSLTESDPNGDDAVIIDVMLTAGPALPDLPDFFDPTNEYAGLRLAKALFETDAERFRGRVAFFTAATRMPYESRTWIQENGVPVISKATLMPDIFESILELSRGRGANLPSA